MTEWLPEEAAVGRQIRALADAGTAARDPHELVSAVLARVRPRWQRPALAASFLGVLVVALVVSFVALQPSGSRPATAQVNGVTYGVGIARSIDLSGAALTAYSSATQDEEFATVSATAYQVDDVDPGKVLVMRLVPGQHDDSGSIGEYLVLIRGDGYDLVCPYFRPGDPLAPTVCP